MPVLVLVGENDWANGRLSRKLADQLPNAELEVVPGAGHVANLDAPDAFTEALRRFLDPA
jgi:3-oxoadipate enol-lactonase